tara:strand:- start:189 stop:434 length:246 start_codon:yes stop_codon:yes gene_type:complete
MATTFKVFIDGQYKTLTADEYTGSFGYKPTSPREGERLFGGRYKYRKFAVETPGNQSTSGSLGEVGTEYNTAQVSVTSSEA